MKGLLVTIYTNGIYHTGIVRDYNEEEECPTSLEQEDGSMIWIRNTNFDFLKVHSDKESSKTEKIIFEPVRPNIDYSIDGPSPYIESNINYGVGESESMGVADYAGIIQNKLQTVASLKLEKDRLEKESIKEKARTLQISGVTPSEYSYPTKL